MPDRLSPQQRHHIMSSIHATSTKPELRLRKALWKQGFRYRINDKRLPGSPDIVFPKYRSVVFIHGCFWHGHKDCPRYVVPKTNTEFWVNKVARNQKRDEEKWRQLEAKDWSVIIVWECELEKNRFDATINWVVKEILKNGETYRKREAERRQYRQIRIGERRELTDAYNQVIAEIKQRHR